MYSISPCTENDCICMWACWNEYDRVMGGVSWLKGCAYAGVCGESSSAAMVTAEDEYTASGRLYKTDWKPEEDWDGHE